MTTIFVFGSNLAGRHGAGAALHATLHCGARYGVGIGRTGDAYAIPTKDERIQTMPLAKIKPFVDEFRGYASAAPELEFFVTRLGCGLAGYTDSQIAPMFRSMPSNVILPRSWGDYLVGEFDRQYHDHP